MADARFGRRIVALFLALVMVTTSSAIVFAEIGEDVSEIISGEDTIESTDEVIHSDDGVTYGEGISYSDVKAEYASKGYVASGENVTVFGDDGAGNFVEDTITGNGESVITIRSFTDDNNETRRAFVWGYTDEDDPSTNKNKSYTFDVMIAKSGLYNLAFDYCSMPGANAEITRDIYIDGVLPFNEAANMPLRKAYIESGSVTQTYVGEGYRGDDIRPSIIETYIWQSDKIYDNEFSESLPIKFYLSAGEHTLTLVFHSQTVAYSSIKFTSADDPISYAEYSEANLKAGRKTGTSNIYIEAEEAYVRSSSGVRREYNTDPSASNYIFGSKVLNTIGGKNWDAGGEAATWKIDISEAGLYRLGFYYEQSWNEGLTAFRQLKINGEVPFEEAKEIRFEYGANLQEMVIGPDGGYLFYLEPGDTITLTVVQGGYASIIAGLEDIVDRIMNLYSSVRVITGSDPDANYDYNLERYLPNLDKDLNDISSDLRTINKLLYDKNNLDECICITRPGMVTNFASIADDFDKWRRNKLLIPGALGDVTTNATNITTWVTTIKAQALEIDRIFIAPEQKDFQIKKAGVFDRLISFFVDLWLSFFKDYNNIGNTSGEVDNIDVWIGRGTEYCEILREQIKRDFTPESNVGININILPSGQLSASGTNVLMLSYISGNAPDLIMAGGANDAIEFAIRDAMEPLEDCDGFEAVKSRFYQAQFDACSYNGHIYAVPETVDFSVMFYRTDIFEKLGLKVPTTWDELFGNVIPILYENDMQFWYSGGYDLILYQYGGTYYRDDYDENGLLQENIRSGLDTTTAYEAFVAYTDMYNTQGLPVAINFYNQFRYGDVPIGISNFGTYMQFLIAAPEISGKWEIAALPQSVLTDKDGNEYISSATNGLGGSYCFIMDNVTNGKYNEKQFETKKASAWKFIEWWTRADVQEYYAAEVEAVIGRDARWLSSNIEAFKNSAWESDHLATILESQSMAVVTPNVLGGYYTSRHVTNAFNRTVVSRSYRARDSLIKAVKDINKEIWAKREEYHTGIPTDANTLA